jgi:hypothetical protein
VDKGSENVNNAEKTGSVNSPFPVGAFRNLLSAFENEMLLLVKNLKERCLSNELEYYVSFCHIVFCFVAYNSNYGVFTGRDCQSRCKKKKDRCMKRHRNPAFSYSGKEISNLFQKESNWFSAPGFRSIKNGQLLSDFRT